MNFRVQEKSIWVLEKSWKFVSKKTYEPWVQLTIFSKKLCLVEINVENCTHIWAKVFVILYASSCTNCRYNFNPCTIFGENDIIFSDSQPRLGTRKINGGRKFKMSRKHLLHMKMKNIGHWEFDHSSTLNLTCQGKLKNQIMLISCPYCCGKSYLGQWIFS